MPQRVGPNVTAITVLVSRGYLVARSLDTHLIGNIQRISQKGSTCQQAWLRVRTCYAPGGKVS